MSEFTDKLLTAELCYATTFPGFPTPHKSYLVMWAKHNEIDVIIDALAHVRKWAERDNITDDTSICKMTTSRLRRLQEIRCREAGIEPAFSKVPV